MDQLNWGYIQLGVVALAFAGLQVWWIGSVFKKRERSRPQTNRGVPQITGGDLETGKAAALGLMRQTDGC